MKTLRPIIYALLFLGLIFRGQHRLLGDDPQPCGNNTQSGPSSPPCPHTDDDDQDDEDDDPPPPTDDDDEPQDCDCPCPDDGSDEGDNPYVAYTGNAHREIRDLKIWGGVGQHQLAWTRISNTRFTGSTQYFGTAANWRHSYQWEITNAGTDSATSSPKFNVVYPNGTINLFSPVPDPSNPNRPLSPAQWRSTAAVTDIVYVDSTSPNGYVLQSQNGWRYYFYLVSGTGTGSVFLMQKFTDAYQNAYTLQYDASNRVTKITEPAGRYLQVFYHDTDISANSDSIYTFPTIGSVTDNQWNTLSIATARTFRYFRYVGPEGRYCEIGDLQFIDRNNTVLTGTTFGTPSSTTTNTFNAAFDNNTGTYFHNSATSGGFVGLDLGTDSTGKNKVSALSAIRFYPPAGQGYKMVGGHLQGLNFQPQYVPVIDHVTTSDGRTVQYTYTKSTDATMPFQYVMLTNATYGDGTKATYAYQQFISGTKPLLLTADDPRLKGNATRIQYSYFTDRSDWLSQISGEINPVTGATLTTIGINGTNREQPVVKRYTSVAPSPGGGTTTSQPSGSKATMVMNKSGRVDQKTDSYGYSTNFTHDVGGAGFLTGKQDRRGNTTNFTRSSQGKALSQTHPDGTAQSWTRSAMGHVTRSTDENNNTINYTRDSQERITCKDYPDGTHETFAYNSFGQQTSHQLRNGYSTSNTYDAHGLKTASTNARGKTTSYTYDSSDRLASITDALQHTTTLAYSERGQITTITNPKVASEAIPTVITLGHDSYGKRNSYTNELGKISTCTHDEFKRLTSTTDPLQHTTLISYANNPSGGCSSCDGSTAKPTQIIRASGRQVQIGYDLENRRTSVTVGAGTADAITTNFQPDPEGNVISSINALGKATATVYDNRNRPTTVTSAANISHNVTLDAVGNVKMTTLPYQGGSTVPTNGTSRVFSTMNEPTDVTDPNGHTVHTSFVAGAATGLKDPKQNVHSFVINENNQSTGTVYPDSSSEGVTLDDVGRAVSFTNRAGAAKTSTFDERDRPINSSWNDGVTPSITKSYDAVGNLLAVDNGVSRVSYAYNDANQCTSETQAVVGNPAGAQTVKYDYDQDGLRTKVTYPDNTLVAYNRNGRGQVSSVATNGQTTAMYAFDGVGRVSGKTLGNGITTAISHDDAGRISAVSHTNSNGAVVGSFQYARNPMGNVTGVTHEDGTGDTFGYDAGGQLNAAFYGTTNPGNLTAPANVQRSTGMAMDPSGNLSTLTATNNTGQSLSTGFAVNNLNQYSTGNMVSQAGTSLGGLTCSYDGKANLGLIQDTGSGLSTGMAYNANNQLTGVTANWTGGASNGPGSTALALGGGTAAAGTSHQMSIGYDGVGRKVSTTVDGTTTFFTHAGSQMISEQDGLSGVQTARYVMGTHTDEVLTSTTSAAMSAGVAGGTLYRHQDALGSVTHLTNSSGQVVEHYSYDAYGTTTAIKNGTGASLTSSAVGNRLLFTGREQISVGGLYDYRTRAYSPTLGRFTATDPIRFGGHDTNLQRYVGNDPIDLADPSGLDPLGHHYVPRSMWKNLSDRLQKIWDAAKNRLDAKGYKKHNGKPYGKVKCSDYAKAVRDKLNEFLKKLGKSDPEELTNEEAQTFADDVAATTEGDIGAYNAGVAEEIAAGEALAAEAAAAESLIEGAELGAEIAAGIEDAAIALDEGLL